MDSESTYIDNPDLCYFCLQGPGSRIFCLKSILYEKYFETFNFYFSKPINEILTGNRTSHVILFKDFLYFDNKQGISRRFYTTRESDIRLKNYTDFYAELEKVHQPNLCTVDQRKILGKRIHRSLKLKKRVYNEFRWQEALMMEKERLGNPHEHGYQPLIPRLHHKTRHILKNINQESRYLEDLNINETYGSFIKETTSNIDAYQKYDKFNHRAVNGDSFITKMHDIYYPDYSSFLQTTMDRALENDNFQKLEFRKQQHNLTGATGADLGIKS